MIHSAACPTATQTLPIKTLKLKKSTLRRLQRDLDEAVRLSEQASEPGDALRALAGNARLIEACARRALDDGGIPLPAGRLRGLLAPLLRAGEARLTEDQLTEALRPRRLTQRELWAVPEVLRILIAEGFESAAQAILRDARACEDAERWVRRPFPPRRPSPAFVERALMRCGESALPRARAVLERCLRARGDSPEHIIRQAHADRASARVRLENLLSAMRLLDGMNWQTRFEALSPVDAELRRDPVYPRMDDASRQLLREQVTRVAEAAGCAEAAVARHAVAAGRDSEAGCCHWLYDDAGRRELLRRLGRPHARLPKIIPDPKGRRVMAALTASAALITWALARWTGAPWPALVPVGWASAHGLLARLYPLRLRPLRLLRLEFARLPEDCRALVVTPVLVPDVAHAEAMCDNLEALGALEADPNLDFLLLADFADADRETMPGDSAIVEHIARRVEAMNRRAGRAKYHYLHRPRTLLEPDGRWMGRDRKRGALMDLNRLLTGGPSAFTADGAALRNRFAFVVTLDADTRMLPGTAHRLAGAMAHPMNRRYAVMQPRMETTPSACRNRFTQICAGAGGLDAYPTAVSSLWMDATGVGVYGGKGIYRIEAFRRALEGALPEGRILSHDLIEGALAGAASLGDLALYDGAPSTPEGWLRRAHRWTRGDWQLIPVLAHPKLKAADRFRIIDNLLRSLNAPALWLLFAVAAWTGSGECLAAGLAAAFLDPLLNPLDGAGWTRALVELCALPLRAGNALDAILRALWRMGVSGRRLLDWVPSADAEGAGGPRHRLRRAAALLLLPGALRPGGLLIAGTLTLLFMFGPDWVRTLAGRPVAASESLDDGQRAFLLDIARDTWRFFSETVDGLPPDNLQIDPPAGAARRTSPTNIGLYLLSCVSAAALDIIPEAERDARIKRALDMIDGAEKWRGHLFNWLDPRTAVPLRPRYVSAVDSGNLAACALACADAVGDAALSSRLRALAEGMDFDALYDHQRDLFRIGYDAEADMPSQSHYDLLASESRILSYTAVMLGQVPVRHWQRLGRGCAAAGGGAALLSWSGTMFEYLMPELLMPAPAASLMGRSVRAAIQAQIDASTPWGVSESGYHAFDADMNYQYRAFGLKALSLDGDAVSGVIAPYAAALALAARPRAAAENLEAMSRLHWRGPLGFYEAADARNPGGDPALVKSHMAHHQGMILCAVCNALTDNALARHFMADPRARAVSLLLEDRPGCAPRLRPRRKPAPTSRRPAAGLGRGCQAGETHLLSGREARALVTADGAVHYARGGFDATRFGHDLTNRPDAARLYLRAGGRVEAVGGEGCRVRCDAGSASFEQSVGPLNIRMSVSLSPEDDALYRSVTIANGDRRPVRAEVMDVVPVALARPEDLLAHAAFQNLFVVSEPLGDDGLLFRRRPRNPGEVCPTLAHRVRTDAPVSRESDYEKLMRRGVVPSFDLTGATGAVLNPVSALKATLDIAPGATETLCFALKLADGDPAIRFEPERAAALGRARVEAMVGFLGLTPGQYHRLDRMAALLYDPRLAARAKADDLPAACAPKEALWAMGISGDRPILSQTATEPGQAPAARLAVKAQAFYHAMGLDVDLALIDAGPTGYCRPVRDMLRGAVELCPLPRRDAVFILENLTPQQRSALRRASSIPLDAVAIPKPLPPTRPFDPGRSTLEPENLRLANGYGGFDDGGGYVIDVRPGHPTPAPWCNLLAERDGMGILLTERGGGFLWHANSRSSRLTEYRGDPMREPFPLALRLIHPTQGAALDLLPGVEPATSFRVRYSPSAAAYQMATESLACRTTFQVTGGAVWIELDLDNRRLGDGWAAALSVRWQMGTDARDAVRLREWEDGEACFASGGMPGVGWLACDDLSAEAEGGLLRVPIGSGRRRLRFAIGWAEDIDAAAARARAVREAGMPEVIEPPAKLAVETPDEALNVMMNGFLLHQVRASRVFGRTGFYQPGGAYGFRDQLQDMLALIPEDAKMAREHLLLCAGRQFAAGDVMHWWHMPALGVRTRITDDRLFLPFVAAEYVRLTGDGAVLAEIVPYLADAPIPEGREDLFQAMAPGDVFGTLHDHCMRAFRASTATGSHGLALMGAGDWNDGMNRVGHQGRGESVWLSEFIATCADRYAEICPEASDAEWLRALARRHRGAVELYGWDGGWYRRAYADDGAPLGSAESDQCRIDLIAQAWAVFAGLEPSRCRAAMDAAWTHLADESLGVIRLLDPPFDLDGADPGYIRGYPPGVRENGAQYTHAACWMLLALTELGDADRAHRALRMLLPPRHADAPEKAARYAVEPYVTAADIYALKGREGRGGWTWYTGSAAWLYVAALRLLGYERRGERVRLNALLGDWPRVSVTLTYGKSRYHLVCGSEDRRVTLDGAPVGEEYIVLQDDGGEHVARFPPRR